MMNFYSGAGAVVSREANALASISVEYGRANGADYYLIRIPRYTVDGRRFKPKVAITSADGSVGGSKVSTLTFANWRNNI